MTGRRDIAAGLRARASAASRWAARIPRPGGPRWPLALAAYVVAALWATWPLARGLGGTTYGGPGDGWAMIWQTWERERNGVGYFRPEAYPDLAWPFETVTSTATFLSTAAVELPNVALLRLGAGDVAAYNLIVLAGLVLSSIAMYGAVRRLGGAPGVAFWAGLAFMLVPWHLEKASIHPSLALMAWLPLAVLGVVEFARRPGPRAGALLVAACALGMYTHVYYGLMAGMVLAVGVPVVLVAASARREVLRTLPRMAAVAGAVALAAAPLALALRAQRDEVTQLIDRPLYLDALAGAWHRYLVPSPDNPLFGAAATRYVDGRGLEPMRGELALYLGWITVALAAAALVGVALRRVPVLPAAAAAGVALVGLLFSMPAHARVPGLGEVTGPVAPLQGLITVISTPSRFVALTITGVVLLAALGLQWLRAAVPGRGWALGLVALACVASAAELVVRPEGRVVHAGPSPLAERIRAEVPEGQGVAQYPSTDRSLRPVADQLFHQIHHRRALVNGATVGAPEDGVRHELSLVEDPALPGRLALLGVRWATVEPALYHHAPLQDDRPDAIAAAEAAGGWRTAWTGADGERLLRVTAPAAPGIVARARGFWTEWVPSGPMWLRHDDGRAGALLACVPRAGRHVLRLTMNAFGRERTVRIGDAEVSVPSLAEPPERRIALHLRAGWQWLPVRVVGSDPVVPAEAIPGSDDTRPLALWLGPAAVEGPPDPAAAGACAGPLPDPPAGA